MNEHLAEILKSPMIERIGWSLIHFLWQGAVIAALLWLVLLLVSRITSRIRYALCVLALLLMAAMPAGTYMYQQISARNTPQPTWTTQTQRPSQSTAVRMEQVTRATPEDPDPAVRDSTAPLIAASKGTEAPAATPDSSPQPAQRGLDLRTTLNTLLPYLVAAWLAGVGAMGLWHVGGWIAVQRLRTLTTHAVSTELQSRFAALKQRISVSQPVQLLESAIVQTPMVVGWLRPVILVPVAILSGLSPAQLDAVLLHELAHIRRHDYMVNILQTVVETLLFYHPAVWWVSAQIRQERENCCDDLAAELSGGKVSYAETLLNVQLLSQPTSSSAVAVTGGLLLPRIRRLLGERSRTGSSPKSLLAAALALAVVISLLAVNRPAQAQRDLATTLPSTQPNRTLDAPAGIILDSDGKLAAGATVRLFYNADNWGLEDRIVETVTADAQGRYQFTQKLSYSKLPNDDMRETYLIMAKYSDDAVAGMSVSPTSSYTSYDLRLTAGVSQAIRVIDDQQKPVVGARVSLQGTGDRDSWNPLFRTSFQASSDPDFIVQTTDANGMAMLKSLPRTRYAFLVTAPGYSPYTASMTSPNDKQLDVRLSKAATISGTVQDEQSRPVADAEITFHVAKKVWHNYRVRTDSNGRFSVAVTPKDAIIFNNNKIDGTYEVSLRHPDFTMKQLTLTLAPGQQENLVIQAMPGTLIKGKLLEQETDHPVAGARLMADTPNGRLYVETDRDGGFAFRVVGIGTARLYTISYPSDVFARRDPRGGTVGEPINLTGQQRQVDIQIYTVGKLEPRISVKGKLLMPNGKPASNIQVETYSAAGEPSCWRETFTDAGGIFTIQRAPSNARVYVYGRTKDQNLAVMTQMNTGKADQPASPQLTLTATQSVRILVTDGQGKPLPKTTMAVGPSFDHNTVTSSKLTTDAAGMLTIEHVLPDVQYGLEMVKKDPNDTRADYPHNYVILLPTNGSAPQSVMFSNLIPIRVVDAAGKIVPIEDIKTIQVEMKDHIQWQMGPKPEIKNRLDDQSVLIGREHVLLAQTGNVITLTFITTGGVTARATTSFPTNVDRLDFTLLERIQDTAVTSGNVNGLQNVAADEIAGRIVDREGKPIANASVSFPRNLPFVPDTYKPTTTDANGLFRIPHVRYYLYMQVDAAGYARRWLSTVLPGQPITITLDNSTRLGGKIVTADGKPVAGAQLLLKTSRPRPSYPDMPIRDISLDLKAADNGTYETLLEPGEYEIQVRAEGGLVARLDRVTVKDGQQLDQPITLSPGLRFQIKAIDVQTQKPIEGIKFFIEKNLPAVTLVEPGSERTTNRDGIAEWTGVMPGEQAVDPQTQEYARWASNAQSARWVRPGQDLDNQPMHFDIKPDMPEILVKMEKAMHVTGKVVDKNGGPVAHIFVNVEGFHTGDRRYSRPTNDKGEFDLYIPAKYYQSGMYYVVVSKDPNFREVEGRSEEFAPSPGGQATFVVQLSKQLPATSQPKP